MERWPPILKNTENKRFQLHRHFCLSWFFLFKKLLMSFSCIIVFCPTYSVEFYLHACEMQSRNTDCQSVAPLFLAYVVCAEGSGLE